MATILEGYRAGSIRTFTLTNRSGFQAVISNLGATVVALKVPDRFGGFGNVVLGLERLDDYAGNGAYLGAICGRYSNRIAAGRFSLLGRAYRLAQNNGPNHLHGGNRGFDKALWIVDQVQTSRLILKHVSPDGDEGYPGRLLVKVTYTLTEDNCLKIDYEAETDAPTVVNLTNHSYFNLGPSGVGGQNILDHQLRLQARAYTPVDDHMIPTGEIASVEGTPFDFREFTPIGTRINSGHPQLKIGCGYDHNFVIDNYDGSLRLAAEVFEAQSGRRLQMWTTEPGFQLYTGNFLGGSLAQKFGPRFGSRCGFCLEAQHFPDSPNKSHFPDTKLLPGQVYRQTTMYRFDVVT